MTRLWIGTGSLEKSAYYFAADGQVYQNPTGFTAAALAATPASQRGSYAVDDNTLTIKWASGQSSVNKLEDVHDNAFNWDTGIFLGVKPFDSSQQLAGSFEGGNSVSFGGGGVSASNDLTFSADGTYAQGGVVTASASSSESTTDVGSASSSGGKWQLNGWVLALTDTKGQVATGVAFPVETDDKTQQVTRFYFQNVAYKRL
ncbi:hypothetical protein [Hymenobacter sp. BRD67]|uniref:hypothetical protein n=1 Tax=Hymenobacter sp. BRD67 TaxID=2675877 RepID=UPI0015673C23|nr:hypothetical protein [Hymenobacter sp. BRD67]QKG51782.1 hypothetical protein GKZ67_03185 [Hymenobacter sp. BRD67]